jgi:DNA invertase Pin-like site-specific DNA recombinase
LKNLETHAVIDRAWAFCAVSSGPQEATLADQESWARTIAAANHWEIARVFSGVGSGRHGVRKLLTRLVAELQLTPESERPSRVLMLRLDRVGRGRVADGMFVMRELEDLGVTIHTRDGGDESMDEPMKELITAAKLAVASFENHVRREKSLAFHARKRAAGEYGSIPPYGFILVDKRLAIYEPEAAIVRTLFERRVAGLGYQRLAQLAAATAPAKIRPNGEFKAFTWAENSVGSILRNKRYRGTIVSEELWDAAAALRGTLVERRAVIWPWPLRGALHCLGCGSTLLGEASGRPGHRNRYYVCRRFNVHNDPSHPHHNADRMEAQFLELLRRLAPRGDLSAYSPAKPELAPLRQRRAALARERSAVEQRRAKAWELAEDGAIDKADLAARLGMLRAEGERLALSIREVERVITIAEVRERAASDLERAFAGLDQTWLKSTVETKRDIARAVAAYLGGMFADPASPGVLLLRSGSSDDFENVSRKTSSTKIEASIAELLRIHRSSLVVK